MGGEGAKLATWRLPAWRSARKKLALPSCREIRSVNTVLGGILDCRLQNQIIG